MGIATIVVACLVVVSLAVPLGIRLLDCAETRYLRVAAAESIAPVLQSAATAFNRASGDRGDCLYAQATEMPPHRVLAELSGGPTAGSTIAPHVWVPESSAWVELARVSESGAQVIEPDPPSLASSPVVLAAPEGAEGIGEDGDAGWELLLPGERSPDRPLVMVDPNRGADGMAAMYAVRQELGTGDSADAAMTEFVRDVQADSAFGHIHLEAVYPGASPLVVVPEQAVWLYNSGGPETPLRVHYPSEGTVSLDYPYVVASDDARIRQAAEDLHQLLREPAYQRRLRELGFREPDGTASPTVADTHGIRGDPPRTHEELTGDALLASVQDWNRLSMPSRALVLADVSAAAAEDLNGGPTRLEVAVDAARLGLDLFPDETDLGLWLMSSELGETGREEVEDLGQLGAPLDRPGATYRDELRRVANSIEVVGGESRLYDNILAAYQRMGESYDEDKINSVIVLTAGSDGGASGISHTELVSKLQDSFDPERPITLFIIAFGDQGGESELTEIAHATSGTAYVTDDAGEIGDIFLSSISRRLCVPDCDG